MNLSFLDGKDSDAMRFTKHCSHQGNVQTMQRKDHTMKEHLSATKWIWFDLRGTYAAFKISPSLSLSLSIGSHDFPSYSASEMDPLLDASTADFVGNVQDFVLTHRSAAPQGTQMVGRWQNDESRVAFKETCKNGGTWWTYWENHATSWTWQWV